MNTSNAIIIFKGKILLAKRAKNSIEGNKRSLPGGRLENYETIENCLKRELFEELGIMVINNFKFFKTYIKHDVVSNYFIVNLEGESEKITLNKSELQEYRYFPIEKIANLGPLAFDQHIIIKDFINQLYQIGKKSHFIIRH